MKVNAIKCKNCNTIIYSRATHDFHWCPCGKCAIDGGFEYIKITGDRKDWELVEYEVLDNLTDGDAKNVLYNDWNLRENKYGIVALDSLPKKSEVNADCKAIGDDIWSSSPSDDEIAYHLYRWG